VAARLLVYDLYKKVSRIRGYAIKESDGTFQPYDKGGFYEFIKKYTERGIYGEYLLKNYTEDEIRRLGEAICEERDLLFNYTGLKILTDRYLVRDEEGRIIELPQEMYMLIAMTIAIPEKERRVEYALKFYEILSQHKVSLATPTLMNARRPHTQLSSCFVLTVEDDLYDIFDNIQKAAKRCNDLCGSARYEEGECLGNT